MPTSIATPPQSIHANALIVGEAGVLIRGASGSGKSALTLQLLRQAPLQGLFARLVADDRVFLEVCNGRLLARPHALTAGQVERYGQGIEQLLHEPCACITCVIDLVPDDETMGFRRYPEPSHQSTIIDGISLPRLALPGIAMAIYGHVAQTVDGALAFLHKLRTAMVEAD